MKKISSALLILMAVFFTGCFDVYEDVTINEDGSGIMASKTDLTTIMQMLSNMGGMGEEKIKMDTTMALGDLAASADELSAEEKALFKGAKVSMNIDSEEGTFLVSTYFPFSKMSEIEKLKKLIEKADVMEKAFEQIDGGGGEEEEEDMMGLGGDKKPRLGLPEEYMKYEYKAGKISRKIDEDKIKEFSGDDEFLQKMKEGMEQGMPPIKFYYTLHLPKPAKKAEGKNLTLSDDKKTVTIENTLDELFESPKNYDFEIEY